MKYKVKVNAFGHIFIGITVFLGVAAVNTGNNLLYMVVSALLSFMLLSGIFSLQNIKGLSLTLIPPPEVYAGTPATFTLMISSSKRIPSFLIGVSYDEDVLCYFPYVRESSEKKISLSFKSRGLHPSITFTIFSDFPVGMFRRYYTVEVPLNLVVFPKLLKVENFHVLHTATGKTKQSLEDTLQKGVEEFHSIKEYSGEPVKFIHWKLFAKTEKLMVREMVSEERKPIVLSLDMVEGNLEEKLSKLAYLCVKLTREGYPVGLRLGDVFLEPAYGERQKRRILTELALFKQSPRV